ncbi:NUDIX domain-containing protein [Planotetraspora phitsanulokensis]|uniref:NTP pyrophosphohydrolase n=1 Tax=Planotetraspora phitsanulokensis TaxID=575192 RepID=A0A8J3XHD7_9ACTN|nr:NUDIX hydrolase [Planotetraspora phitsanulokensis]GII41134.1 NTP pyrophosphohydrolase [Planotetraspora phitsanulokensis]
MTAMDGDGWALCARGHQHWGVHGAAGLLAVHHTDDGMPYVLMQKRAWWSHHGGTWGLPGGARDSHEDAVTGALREAWEEAALTPDQVRVQGVYVDDHGGWSYHTVIAAAAGLLDASAASGESADMRWVAADEVAAKRLHPGFANTWPIIRPALSPLVLVLDVANIVGARAEHGWWKDRAGAANRLLNDLLPLASDGLGRQPEDLPELAQRFPRIIAVLEGAAARGADTVPRLGVDVVLAPGSGDDAIVEVVREARTWEKVLVVTADRGLRERVAELGALVTGPRWLLGQL